jgi:hypothetical protein
MRYHTQSCTLGAILFLAFASLLPGCSPSNEQEAKIKGTVPPADISSQQRREQFKSGMDPKANNYNPGANNRR